MTEKKTKRRTYPRKNSRKSKHYSQEEIDYITENMGLCSVAFMARKLGRTPSGIIGFAFRHFGTSKGTSLQGLYTTPEIADALGVSRSTVRSWITNKGLPAIDKRRISRQNNQITRKNLNAYGIDIEEFFEWLKEHKDSVYIDFNKVNLDKFIYVPDWFKKDYLNKNHYHVTNSKKWSKDEEELMLNLYYQEGKSIKEIAEILGRTCKAVSHKKDSVTKRFLNKNLKVI